MAELRSNPSQPELGAGAGRACPLQVTPREQNGSLKRGGDHSSFQEQTVWTSSQGRCGQGLGLKEWGRVRKWADVVERINLNLGAEFR